MMILKLKFEHILYVTHDCTIVYGRSCPRKGKVVEPRSPVLFKFLHLFLKESSLYTGLEDFLSLLLRCVVKTHAEGVAESMGNIIEIHSDKRRGRMDIDDAGKEAMINWIRPPLHLADNLGMKSMDSRLGGRTKWNFVTQA